MKTELIQKYMKIPESEWKTYRIVIDEYFHFKKVIVAPNKTMARLFLQGSLNPGVKIISITEIKEN